MAKKRPANHRADAEVGYGKPPNASQFKPGQSGNPKGRPKGSLNLATVFARAARETVVINQGGRSRRISKLAAVAIQLTNKAVAGDTASAKVLLALTQAFEPRIEPIASAPERMPDADLHVMQSLLSRFRNYTPGEPDETESK